MLKPIIKAVAVTAVTMSAGGAFAQSADTAYVPFRLNVDAAVTAVQGSNTVTLDVKEGVEDTLKLPLGSTTSVLNQGGTQGRLNAPAITRSRGNISLRLPAQSYRNAEVALYSVNGKRILRGKADASEAVNGVSRRNVAAGVYLLSVKGINGNVFTSRLTHSGGNMSINVTFGGERVFHTPARQLGKKAEAAAGDWGITVSPKKEGYENYTYTLNVTSGQQQYPLQVINARVTGGGGGGNVVYGGHVTYGGEDYQTVVIGTQTWFARNLNYDVPNVESDICYGNDKANCKKYGRLYDFNTALTLTACPAGWHLPSNTEWEVLVNYAGGKSTAGRKLKSVTGWNDYNGQSGNGTDDFGFSALPGGIFWGGVDTGIDTAGIDGEWWSASGKNGGGGLGLYYGADARVNFNVPGASRLSVRCLQDDTTPSYCFWGGDTGCVEITNSYNWNPDAGRTNLENCRANDGFLSKLSDCSDYVPPTTYCTWGVNDPTNTCYPIGGSIPTEAACHASNGMVVSACNAE